MTDEVLDDVFVVPDWSIPDAYNAGYDDGHKQGYGEGYDDGFKAGEQSE